MRKIEPFTRKIDEPQKTEFTKEELLDIIDFYIQYKPLFDKSPTAKDINYNPLKAALDFTRLLYKYNIGDKNYRTNMKKLEEKYGTKYVYELSQKKLDFLEIITILTVIHRTDYLSGGYMDIYEDCIEDGTYYNLLCRLEEIKKDIENK